MRETLAKRGYSSKHVKTELVMQRRYVMGDKGKKDKDKSRKQKTNKQERTARRKLEKQPRRTP